MFSNREGHLQPVSDTRNYPDVCTGIMWEHFFCVVQQSRSRKIEPELIGL